MHATKHRVIVQKKRRVQHPILVTVPACQMLCLRDDDKLLIYFLAAGFDKDCFRTYECHLMGAVPIVHSFPSQDALMRQTPTLIRKDWTKMVQAEEILKFKPATLSRKILIWHYWWDRIQCVKKKLKEKSH